MIPVGTLVMFLTTKTAMATGGMIMPTMMTTLMRMPNQTGSKPSLTMVGKKIGVARMKEYLAKLNYGHMLVDSASIDVFWLEGESKISQFEQIDFLKRFYFSRLPISERTEKMMKKLMVIEENDTFRLSGKTGWSVRNGNNNGWFVGYIEKGEKLLFFATNINPKIEFNMDLFPLIRKEITRNALDVFLKEL